jgi:putative protease
MVGQYIGTVTALRGQTLVLDTSIALNNGDGLCWFDRQGELRGTVVNATQPSKGGTKITPEKIGGIRIGSKVYRNRDHAFLRQVERSRPERKIEIHLCLETTPEGFALHAEDEDGNRATGTLAAEKVPAQKPDQAEAVARRQLAKTGRTPFDCSRVELAWEQAYHLPLATLNTLRRETLHRLGQTRAANRPLMQGRVLRNRVPYPDSSLTYRGNALNQQARAFYQRHGVQEIAPAAESGLDMRGEVVMRTRYCIQHQLGFCDGAGKAGSLREPLYLVDDDGHHYRLRFHCADCEMEVIY